LHTTRLKQHHFIELRAQKKGRDVILVFEKDVGFSLAKACQLDSDTDSIHLARAAKAICKQMLEKAKPFQGFPMECQKHSFFSLLLALVSMILEDSNILFLY